MTAKEELGQLIAEGERIDPLSHNEWTTKCLMFIEHHHGSQEQFDEFLAASSNKDKALGILKTWFSRL